MREDELDHLWTETLVFPHPSLLDDAQMGAYFPMYDGRWSDQTKRAIEMLGAHGLELNSNWALERQSWTCPGCARSKAEIFRKSSQGVLLAKLERHHDHLWDEANRRPVELVGEAWKDILPDGASFVVENIRSLVVRFEEALVCSECNAADGKAKLALETDSLFTFAASEIRQFIKPAPHADHEVNVEIARMIWERERPGFERRVALLGTLVDDLVAGNLQRRREGAVRPMSTLERVGADDILWKAFLDASRGTSRRGFLQGMRSEFLARSVWKDVMKRVRVPTGDRSPTDEEYACHVPNARPQAWAEAGEDWTCPCCGRGKRATMRMSAKKKWSGAIRSVAQYDVLLDENEIDLRLRLFPDFQNDLHLKERRWVDVCSDCADIVPRLLQERRDLSDGYLTIDEMKVVLAGVGDHSPHDVDFAEAAGLAAGNRSYRQAIQAMDAFAMLRTAFRSKMKFASDHPELRKEAFERLDFELKVERGIEDAQERKEIMTMLRDGDYGRVRKRSRWK
tara:strand:- start:18332 stop:19864 length:1533 start_codon:yes stop_codon:yes gene_type:complete